MVTGIYVPDENGDLLFDLLQRDWQVFDTCNINPANATLLLAEILDETTITRRKYLPSSSSRSDTLERWRNVKEELKHQNRFFPKTAFDLDRIEPLLSHLQVSVKDVTRAWYRARIQEEAAFPPEEMGAPPRDRVKHGRANPAGIPYLYLASARQTAAAEIRPHPGEIVCIAEFKTPETLSLVDLRHPRMTVSPFSLSSENEVAQIRGDLDFLEYFGEELTRPIVPQAAAIEYIPSQYLCEFIKGCGYDGVLYCSSVGEGSNLALFDPALATTGEVMSSKIERVSVELSA